MLRPSYSSFSSEESRDLPHKQQLTWYFWKSNPKQSRNGTVLVSLMVIGIILGIVLILQLLPFITFTTATTTTSDFSPLYHCGQSPTEALSLGCHFDVISFAWLPTKCFDESLMDEFLSLKNWTWYLDARGQKRVDATAVRNGQYNEIFVSWEYHLVHCTYMWRKMHRAILRDDGVEAVDGYIGSFHHTEHCSNMLLGYNTEEVGVTNTFIYAKWPACGRGAFRLDDRNEKGWYRVVNGEKVFSVPSHEEFAVV